jgi:hypothetical protein
MKGQRREKSTERGVLDLAATTYVNKSRLLKAADPSSTLLLPPTRIWKTSKKVGGSRRILSVLLGIVCSLQ